MLTYSHMLLYTCGDVLLNVKTPLIDLPEFVLYFEEYNGYTFIHCDVKVKWTKEVKKKLKEVYKTITDSYSENIFANHEQQDKKHEKFLKMFGFEYLNSFVGKDNKDYDLYVWRR